MRYTTIGTGSLAPREVSVISLGAMRFGTLTDEATSFAILDRYVEAGGNFSDTSNNYLFLVHGTQLAKVRRSLDAGAPAGGLATRS